MYDIIKSVILEGVYDLSDILMKIDVYWLQSKITDEEKADLVKLARENAEPTHSVDIMKKIEDIDTRLKKLENKEPTEPGEEYPEYVVGKWYYKGDKITFTDGKRYECIAPDGVVCTWSPTEYPAYWKEVK